MPIPHITISRFNERWLVLGDVTNSTRYTRLIDQYTNGTLDDKNELLFQLTHEYNNAIETIFIELQRTMPEQAALANTMGDGFIAVGLPGHGNTYIQYEFPAVFLMCWNVKKETEKKLSTTRDRSEMVIQEKRKEKGLNYPYPLPELKLKLCVHQGYIVTTLGVNRFIGECINRASRVASSAFELISPDDLVLTDEYFRVLPEDLKSSTGATQMDIELKNYFEEEEENKIRVWRIPFEDNDFWQLAIIDPENSYYEYYGRTTQDDMTYLQQKLYERR